MSHLGRNLSALVDGELSPAERDRAHAHLVACEQCRAEANALRELKKGMRGLPDVPADDALTRRLLFIGEVGGPVPPRGRRGFHRGVTAPGGRLRHRGRYVALGVASCIVTGLSVTAFSVGGSPSVPGPRVTPQVEMYSVEHAMTTGEIPFSGPAVPGPEITGAPQVP